MPAKSKAQQRFMGMVRAAQKGKLKRPSPEVSRAADSMPATQARDFAKTKHTNLPEKSASAIKLAAAKLAAVMRLAEMVRHAAKRKQSA